MQQRLRSVDRELDLLKKSELDVENVLDRFSRYRGPQLSAVDIELDALAKRISMLPQASPTPLPAARVEEAPFEASEEEELAAALRETESAFRTAPPSTPPSEAPPEIDDEAFESLPVPATEESKAAGEMVFYRSEGAYEEEHISSQGTYAYGEEGEHIPSQGAYAYEGQNVSSQRAYADEEDDGEEESFAVDVDEDWSEAFEGGGEPVSLAGTGEVAFESRAYAETEPPSALDATEAGLEEELDALIAQSQRALPQISDLREEEPNIPYPSAYSSAPSGAELGEKYPSVARLDAEQAGGYIVEESEPEGPTSSQALVQNDSAAAELAHEERGAVEAEAAEVEAAELSSHPTEAPPSAEQNLELAPENEFATRLPETVEPPPPEPQVAGVGEHLPPEESSLEVNDGNSEASDSLPVLDSIPPLSLQPLSLQPLLLSEAPEELDLEAQEIEPVEEPDVDAALWDTLQAISSLPPLPSPPSLPVLRQEKLLGAASDARLSESPWFASEAPRASTPPQSAPPHPHDPWGAVNFTSSAPAPEDSMARASEAPTLASFVELLDVVDLNATEGSPAPEGESEEERPSKPGFFRKLFK